MIMDLSHSITKSVDWNYFNNNRYLTKKERFHVCNNLDNASVIYEAEEKICQRSAK